MPITNRQVRALMQQVLPDDDEPYDPAEFMKNYMRGAVQLAQQETGIRLEDLDPRELDAKIEELKDDGLAACGDALDTAIREAVATPQTH